MLIYFVGHFIFKGIAFMLRAGFYVVLLTGKKGSPELFATNVFTSTTMTNPTLFKGQLYMVRLLNT